MSNHLLAFRDFRGAGTDGLDAALVSANEWLAHTGIRPLNVETIVEAHARVASNTTDRGVRVWYLIE